MKSVALYSLHLSPTLWKQVGSLRREDFERLQQAIARAQAAGALNQARGNEVVPGGREVLHPVLRVDVDGLVLVYERDDERRTLTLLKVEGLASAGG